MAQPGFSLSELLHATEKVIEICEAFSSKQNNARKRIQELADTVAIFRTNLLDQQWILESTGRHYPGHQGFAKLLEECSDFIRKYGSVLGPNSNVAERFFRTAKWPREEQKTVERLTRMLNLHVQASNMFALNLLMSDPSLATPSNISDGQTGKEHTEMLTTTLLRLQHTPHRPLAPISRPPRVGPFRSLSEGSSSTLPLQTLHNCSKKPRLSRTVKNVVKISPLPQAMLWGQMLMPLLMWSSRN